MDSEYFRELLGGMGDMLPKYAEAELDPQFFANLTKEDISALRDGPDNELYWDAWAWAIDSAEVTDGAGHTWELSMVGDTLYAVRTDMPEDEYYVLHRG
jgi:hypothetical protein